MQQACWLLWCEPVGVILAAVAHHIVLLIKKDALILIHEILLCALTCMLPVFEQLWMLGVTGQRYSISMSTPACKCPNVH